MSITTEEITATIRDRIRSGDYRPNHRVPSQSEMAEEFGVSDRIIIRIVADLREQGYLLTLPHKGSYVLPRERWKDTEVETSG